MFLCRLFHDHKIQKYEKIKREKEEIYLLRRVDTKHFKEINNLSPAHTKKPLTFRTLLCLCRISTKKVKNLYECSYLLQRP